MEFAAPIAAIAASVAARNQPEILREFERISEEVAGPNKNEKLIDDKLQLGEKMLLEDKKEVQPVEDRIQPQEKMMEENLNQPNNPEKTEDPTHEEAAPVFGKDFTAEHAARILNPRKRVKPMIQNIGHKANIDKSDIAKPMPEIDYDPDDLAEIPEKYRADFIKRSAERGYNYIRKIERILKKYPRADLLPNRFVHLRRLLDGTHDVYARKLARNDPKSLIFSLINDRAASANQHYTDQKKSAAEEEEKREAERDQMDHIADMMGQSYKDQVNLLLSYRKKGVPVDMKRSLAQDYFFLPETCTGQAIALLVIDQTSEVVASAKTLKYNVPSIQTVQELALRMGYRNVEEFSKDVESGMMMKAMRAVRKITLGDNQSDELPEELTEYLTAVDTEKARDDEEFQELYNVEYADHGKPTERIYGNQDEEVDEIKKALGESTTKLKLAPFRYGARYTYKILYYAYMNKYYFKLPFGRTIPNLSWLYIFSYLIDPNNMLRLRLNVEESAIRLGSLTLLEKFNFYNSTGDQGLRTMFQSMLKDKSDKTKLSNVVISALTSTIQMEQKKKKMKEIDDELSDLKRSIISLTKQAQNILKSNNLDTNSEYKQRCQKLLNLSRICLKDNNPDAILQSFLSSLGLECVANRPKMQEITDMLSFVSFSMAREMVSKAHLWASGNQEAGAWYVYAMKRHYSGASDRFSLILKVLRSSRFEGIAKLLFRDENKLSAVKATINRVETMILESTTSTQRQAELIELMRISDGTKEIDNDWLQMNSNFIVMERQSLFKALDLALKNEKLKQKDIGNLLGKRTSLQDEMPLIGPRQEDANQIPHLHESDRPTETNVRMLALARVRRGQDGLVKTFDNILESTDGLGKLKFQDTILEEGLAYLSRVVPGHYGEWASNLLRAMDGQDDWIREVNDMVIQLGEKKLRKMTEAVVSVIKLAIKYYNLN